MIFIDSWIWIEFFSKDERWKKAKKILEKLERTIGVISTTVLMEVRFIIRRRFGVEKADRVINIIESFEKLEIVPVTSGVAVYAADLRNKYYTKDEKEFSYGDAIHLAAAVMTGCETLFSGDLDFREIDEVETVIV